MPFERRLEVYKQIERIRERPLISYVTSTRQNAGGQMGADVIQEFAKQINRIPEGQTKVDILIISNGGDPTVSWRISSILREKFEDISVLLPFAAFSAATLIALGANEIVMHPFSNLGPVDPQLTYQKPNQSGQATPINFGSEDLRHFLDFARKDVGVSDQEQLERALELLATDVGSIPIGIARRSAFLALEMGEKLLALHMLDQNKAKAIAEALNKSFYHHGYPLNRSEAIEIGLPVTKPQKELESLMWRVWEDLDDEMQCSHPFNPLEIIMNEESVADLLDPVTQIQVPANLPNNVTQNIYNQVLQQISLVTIPPVKYCLLHGVLESIRCRSTYKTNGKINAIRKPDLSIGVNMLPISQGWEFIELQS